MNVRKELLERWSVRNSIDLYGINNWSNGYFSVNDDGEVTVTPFQEPGSPSVSMMDIVRGVRERGFDMPVLIRIGNILNSQIQRLHKSFDKAIEQTGYQGVYKGVFPVKVNQQQEVVESITRCGKAYHHGLEAGSKAELLSAIAYLDDPDACLICNGYKDEEFIDLGLYARKLGIQCFLVVEMPGEVQTIIRRSKELGIRPLIGLRLKLSTSAGGHWMESGGDRSVFGLNAAELVSVIDTLREAKMLNCLRLLHYHIGSQIPNIRDIRNGIIEAVRTYSGLVQEGAPMGFLDLGGGLAVDYDGSHTNYHLSRNYSLDEYCVDVVETVSEILTPKKIPHPTLITESGRATVAYNSVLVFNILDATKFESAKIPPLPPDANEHTKDLVAMLGNITTRNLQECFHDAIYYRDEIRILFKNGRITFRERATAESAFWNIMSTINRESKKLKYIPDEFENLETAMADIYYANFSVFQSLPDAWAIDQLFPIMPLHRLKEMPNRQGIISDITCDCDGKLDNFVDLHDERHTLPLHELREDEEYYLGAFLVGAYQETLGDLHNLLGDTNVVSVNISPEDGHFEIVKEIEGDSVADVLSYVEYDTKAISNNIREHAEQAVRNGVITPAERRTILAAFEDGLRGYTYFER